MIRLVIRFVGLVAYAWLVYSFAQVVLQITAFVAVAAVLVIMGWIGLTMATTPPSLESEPFTTEKTAAATTSKDPK